jgi:hypothetical protein
MTPARFRGTRPRPGRRTSAIIALVVLASATGAGQALAATSLHVVVTGKPKAVSNLSTATFRWKAQGKVRATVCSLDRARFTKCKSGKRYSGLKDGKHRFRVEVKGSGRTKKIASVSWLVDRTAPTAPVAAGGSLTWQAVPSIVITVGGSTDAGSGLAGYEYRTSTDGGTSWSTPAPGALATVSLDGETLVQFAAVDRAGNVSAWAPGTGAAEATARIDNLAPFVPTVSGGDLQWRNTSVVIVSASDGVDVGGAGFDHFEYRTSTDGGQNWSSPTAGADVPISADGETFVQFRSFDAAGNVSNWAPTTPDAGSTVRLDRTLPTDPIVTGGTAGWQHIASALVTAGGSTDALGSGVAFYQYRTSTDGGQTWSGPALGSSLSVSAEGLTLVQFRSVDLTNLDSAWIQTAVQIDRTNPSAPSLSGGSPAWQNVQNIDISASGATDSGGSGIAGYQYRSSTDGGSTWSTPTFGWDDLVGAEGETLVQFRAVDGAGNTSGWVAATARIDHTAPGAPTVAGGSLSWQNAPSVDITPTSGGDSGGSGVASYEYRTSTNAGQTWSSPTPGATATVSAEGTTLVQFRAIDGAGNPSVWAPVAAGNGNTVKLDHTLPTLSGVSGGSLSWKNQSSTTITAGTHADTGGSGFSHDEYRTSTDGGANWSPAATGTSVTIGAEGETLVQFRAVDNAGNASDWLPASPTAASTVRLDRTDPTNPAVTGGSSSWQSVPSILLSASGSTDAGSGVTGYQYATSADNGQTWSSATTGSSFSVVPQGTTLVRFRAMDGAGRQSGWTVATAKIDRTAPAAPVVTGGSATWKNAPSVTVSAASSTDSGGSAFAGDVYRTSTDGGATWSATASGSSVPVSGQGETLVQFAAVDNAGNQSAWVQATVRLDRSNPTDPVVSGGSLSWSKTAVTISASGSTDAGGSGFAYQYRTSANGSTWSSPLPGGSVQIATDGTTYVQFRAIDNAANASNWVPSSTGASNTARVDATAPTLPTVSGGSANWQNASSVTLTAAGSTDATSSVAGYQYRTSTDGTNWSSATSGSSVQISANGLTYVEFQTTDNAGNASGWTAVSSSSTVRLDHALPAAPTVTGGSLSWSTSPVTLTISGASDALSGLKGVYVRTSNDGGATWSSATLLSGTTYQVTTQGTTLVQAQAADNAGNLSAWTPASSGAANTVRYDNVLPTAPSAQGGQGTGTCKKHLTVSVIAATDAGSGISRYDYRVSTNAGVTWGSPVTNQSSFSPSNTGTYYVQFRAVDNAGNVGPWGPGSPITGSIACIR